MYFAKCIIHLGSTCSRECLTLVGDAQLYLVQIKVFSFVLF